VTAPSASLADAFQRFQKSGGGLDLSDRTKLRLTGADRVRYLNGQTTCDVRRITPGAAVPGCVLTAKGKLSAEIFITATDEALWIDADASQRETLPARLERYIIADDVAVEDITDDYRLLHLLGTARDLAPPAHTALLCSEATRFATAGTDLLLPTAAFTQMWERLPSAPRLYGADFAEALRVLAGVPRWGAELDENTLPPEAGLEKTHIDYHKGCYIGQEVISRIRSVGHVNRQLCGFISDTRQPLWPGMLIFADGAQKQVGTITSVGWSFTLESPVALGYLKRGSPAGGLLARVAAESSASIPVTPQELPFSP
jgi:folate-binding protein YgfZ